MTLPHDTETQSEGRAGPTHACQVPAGQSARLSSTDTQLSVARWTLAGEQCCQSQQVIKPHGVEGSGSPWSDQRMSDLSHYY